MYFPLTWMPDRRATSIIYGARVNITIQFKFIAIRSCAIRAAFGLRGHECTAV